MIRISRKSCRKNPYCLLYMLYVCICSHILFHIFCLAVPVKGHKGH